MKKYIAILALLIASCQPKESFEELQSQFETHVDLARACQDSCRTYIALENKVEAEKWYARAVEQEEICNAIINKQEKMTR